MIACLLVALLCIVDGTPQPSDVLLWFVYMSPWLIVGQLPSPQFCVNQLSSEFSSSHSELHPLLVFRLPAPVVSVPVSMTRCSVVSITSHSGTCSALVYCYFQNRWQCPFWRINFAPLPCKNCKAYNSCNSGPFPSSSIWKSLGFTPAFNLTEQIFIQTVCSCSIHTSDWVWLSSITSHITQDKLIVALWLVYINSSYRYFWKIWQNRIAHGPAILPKNTHFVRIII
jgi:hypothetical protein